MAIRKRTWTSLINTKFQVYFIDGTIDKFLRNERRINVFLALVSFSSISAWAVWDVVPWLWGGIVAASNIVVAIRPYFSYGKYAKELTVKYANAQDIQLAFDRLWYDIDYGNTADSEIAQQYFNLHKKHNDLYRFPEGMIIPKNKKVRLSSKKHIHQGLFFEFHPCSV